MAGYDEHLKQKQQQFQGPKSRSPELRKDNTIRLARGVKRTKQKAATSVGGGATVPPADYVDGSVSKRQCVPMEDVPATTVMTLPSQELDAHWSKLKQGMQQMQHALQQIQRAIFAQLLELVLPPIPDCL